MSDRDAYVQKMKAKLDEWNAEIDRLAAKASQAQADARLKYNEEIDNLKKQREEADRRMRELQSSSEEAWNSVREGMEAAWDRMNNALKDAVSRFK